VDIAVDLVGHTDGARHGILAYRPAPVQAAYLGYPGTSGAAFIDYLIADPIVLPLDQQPFYTEKIVHLPDCYLVNDSHQRKISDASPPHRGSMPRGSLSPRRSFRWRTIWPATVEPIFTSIRGLITPIPVPATRCGPAFPCLHARAAVSPGVLPRACSTPSACP